ncbi:hypothetical protein A3D42_03275 [Candidatus Nomurabacteria bacterium RIFCSPHIGHO2_02_FULL_41_18]|uniref:Phosphoglycolate phosphatase n=1 Tax=Candidatus Nomurabacteria bacterium RIFCSPHIGHO2_02_FULL_41_18 TaxID=1801754 RepID=A0A1F6W8N5_9BACT|nr:MAG: hypothetical protein A2737_01365 [Candidatus Nomurabacteria bacterium RIFCSPHIGHO2_01_FULL_41_71]OGI78055.1 MAG: hypothetical protein A3D42_03275 [Candidatus Nomurabacteria bacterium RIFCSPHIGHO2_02_FULL_41_18]OGI90110.1 MAG: hypothetical protein A3B01_03315 [Candidatus Nomurabacteria bacterium RIFCSPLOWO2_01_FULL_41_52b]OGJ00204.1 MAG: hypothetical protein A3I90_01920 [Candidatus Nomurabacteria bacterium RIFCSPLOWO2_02_FULL_41_9]
MKIKKLVLFDFDGVLVDTLIMSYEISKEVDNDLSMPAFKSLFDGNIFHSLNNHPTIKQHPDFFGRYAEKLREFTIPQSLKDLVRKLREEYQLAIVSAIPTHLINEILNRENALFFADVLGGDIHTSKVYKIKILLEKYAIASQNAVYTTDTVGDVLEARECGVKAVAVAWGFQEEATLQKATPAKIVHTPEALLEAVKEIL